MPHTKDCKKFEVSRSAPSFVLRAVQMRQPTWRWLRRRLGWFTPPASNAVPISVASLRSPLGAASDARDGVAQIYRHNCPAGAASHHTGLPGRCFMQDAKIVGDRYGHNQDHGKVCLALRCDSWPTGRSVVRAEDAIARTQLLVPGRSRCRKNSADTDQQRRPWSPRQAGLPALHPERRNVYVMPSAGRLPWCNRADSARRAAVIAEHHQAVGHSRANASQSSCWGRVAFQERRHRTTNVRRRQPS